MLTLPKPLNRGVVGARRSLDFLLQLIPGFDIK